MAFAGTFAVKPEQMVELMLETKDLLNLVGGETSKETLLALKEDPAREPYSVAQPPNPCTRKRTTQTKPAGGMLAIMERYAVQVCSVLRAHVALKPL